MEITGCLTLKDLISAKKNKVDQEKDMRSAQKENMYERFRISPRVPLKGEPIDLSKQKGLTPERFPITPVKATDKPLAEPWTPTANLKMLISVASPEIRDREKKKELFRPIENNEREDIGPDNQQFETGDDIDELEKRPSRKQKSLGLLCQKFLARYPSYPISTEKTTISLDEAASSLGVERRRIYDIVNVLESLNLVSRVAKNQYCWHGQHNLNGTLQSLQMEGEKQKYGAQIACFQHKELGVDQRKSYSVNRLGALSLELSEADSPSVSASSRKDKSLRIMSQKFVMLFLVSTTKTITLEIAAKILIEESQDISDHSKFKTKVRRLYDIANVLTSLGLIKKVHVTEERGRKPAFKWIGPVDFRAVNDQKIEVTTTTPSPDSKSNGFSYTSESSKQRFLRHSSFNHVQSINTVKRKVCSEPSSPQKAQKESTDVYTSKMAHLASICRQKIEEDAKCHKLASDNGSRVPFSFVVPIPVDSDFPGRHSGHQELSLSQNEANAQLNIVHSSNLENSSHGILANQPYMYVPSTSVFMLCGNTAGDEILGRSSPTSSQRTTPDSSQPAKRQRIGSSDDAPFPLKLWSPETPFCEFSIAKKPPHPSEEDENMVSTHIVQEAMTEQAAVKDALKTKVPAPQEHVKSSALTQYLYVPSAAGLNGFNLFLPASQAAGALGVAQSRIPNLNVPYVMVPSTHLAAFPFICSPAITTSHSNGPALSPGSMNYNHSGIATPPHIMFGSSAVGSPLLPEPSTDVPQCASPAYVSQPFVSSATTDSLMCTTQPVPVKLQKSPTPLTPKSVRPLHKDTFFKTPGSSGVSPALQKKERPQARNSSSAQRRLNICSSD
ncbi:transcription factor E2F7 [Pseudophryne corroboree]|uniref:transcription factor E2F7 n=1 Tax=Pseudophryne corroboree TaxID=495146 RepID=UPI0030813A46